MNFPHLSRAAKRIALAAALLGALGAAAGFALAASGPPAPTITSRPPKLTSSTSATFAFSDSEAKVTFRCSLDTAPYAACTSPRSYGGLSAGAHSFSVQAVDASGHTSSATTDGWQVVLTPPSVTIAFPAGGGSYNATGWSQGCSKGPGACGTATDPSGVTSVIVSVQQQATGRWWNGSSFSSSSEVYRSAALTATSGGANWFYALPRPAPDGSYTLHVRATNGVGLQTPSGSPTTSTFTIETAPPPKPTITGAPGSPTNQTAASFSFSDVAPGVSFRCRLDSGAYAACTSPAGYSGLAPASHTFSVVAVDAAGNVSSPASDTWFVDTAPPGPPSITGHPSNPTTSTSATFTFSEPAGPDTDGDGDGQARDATPQCQFDGGAWQVCTSPKSYSGLSAGNHTFAVRAVDEAGNTSTAASFSWAIQPSTGMPFTISGNAPNKLYPGAAAQALPVKLTNPNGVPIYVTSLTATVSATGLPTGCTTASFSIAPATISGAGVQVPANGSVTLPAPGGMAPTIQMTDTHANQDACENATVTINYSGSAHS